MILITLVMHKIDIQLGKQIKEFLISSLKNCKLKIILLEIQLINEVHRYEYKDITIE